MARISSNNALRNSKNSADVKDSIDKKSSKETRNTDLPSLVSNQKIEIKTEESSVQKQPDFLTPNKPETAPIILPQIIQDTTMDAINNHDEPLLTKEEKK